LGGVNGSRHVVIVGASLGGLRTAEELRSSGFEGRLTLLGEEVHLPYDRPPLSKQVLAGRREAEDVRLRPSEAIDALNLDLRLGCRATSLDHERVTLTGGETIPYTDLVIATGVSARRLPHQPSAERIHVLRTVDDSLRLRADLERFRSLLVIGAGFIGAEVAAVARTKGMDVTMVEALPAPFARTLGTQIGARCAQLHQDRGVRIIARAAIAELFASDAGGMVRLVDGRTLEADCLLIGVGTVPNTKWLRGSGIDAESGVRCDEGGRADGRRNVFAVGDVAAWRNPVYHDRRRVEHWTNAAEQAHAVAQTVLGKPLSRHSHEVPYFWSDQYETKVQLVGRPDLADRVDVTDLPGGKPNRLLGTYLRGRHVVAALTFGAPAVLARFRPLVASLAEEEVARALSSELAAIRV
jgi:3-phenylpropionate/trans-cinnamate dioxygenase ferredoxin reductase subunit